MKEYLTDGNFWAILGATIAFFVAAIGSSKGVGIAGEAGAGVLTEDRVNCSCYDFRSSCQYSGNLWIRYCLLTIGKIDISTSLALKRICAFLCRYSCWNCRFGIRYYSGKSCAAGIHMIAKRPEGLGRAITLALMVEMFAILGFIISFLMLGQVG